MRFPLREAEVLALAMNVQAGLAANGNDTMTIVEVSIGTNGGKK